jgi:hypothetical protein
MQPDTTQQEPLGDPEPQGNPDHFQDAGQDAASVSPYQWQKARARRWPLEGFVPVQGFGPEGKHTLWLPAAGGKRRYTFQDGKPVPFVAAPEGDDPELAQMRDEIIRQSSWATMDKLLVGDVLFVSYAAALVRKGYGVSDQDLEFLFSGTGWLMPVLEHVLGGLDGMDTLATAAPKINPDAARTQADLEAQSQAAADAIFADPEPVPAARSWWSRSWNRLTRKA